MAVLVVLTPFIFAMFNSNMIKLAGIRNFSSSAVSHQAINNVTVIGGGLMGSGIAQVSVLEFEL